MSAASFSNDNELGATASCIPCVVDRNDAESSKPKTFVLYVHGEKKSFRCVSCTSIDAEASIYFEEVFDVPVEKTTDATGAKMRKEDVPMEKMTDVKSAKK